MIKTIRVGNIEIGGKDRLTIIAGPCVIESEEQTMGCAAFLHSLMQDKPVHFVFKASYDKANRSSLHAFRGPGIEEGLKILEKVKREFSVPILTDIHLPEDAPIAAEICDILQIPAFLCRQTDLLVAAGKTDKAVNIKKGQFMAPDDMKYVVEKVAATGNHNILLTERGATFGYHNLVSDMRAIPMMQRLGYPVLFDATHSVQLPAAAGGSSGGEKTFIAPLSRAAIGAGCQGIFAEVHAHPAEAKSDAACVLSFPEITHKLQEWLALYACMRDFEI